jgi:hypothetical protein
MYRIVHLFVLMGLVIPFAIYGRNNTKETVCLLSMCMEEVKHISTIGLYNSEIGFQFADVDAIHLTTLLMLS